MPDDRSAWLARVYGAESQAALVQAYDDWARTYDDDVMAFGYMHPALVVAMVARYVSPDAGPVLDVGAGTGFVGMLLAPLGYGPLLGIDLSEGMLAIAKAKGVYDELHRMVLGERLDFEDGRFAAVIGAGVFTHGHAPAAAFDELARVARPGGHVFLAISDRAQDDLGYRARQADLTEAGRWRLLDQTQPFIAMPKAGALGSHPARIYSFEVLK